MSFLYALLSWSSRCHIAVLRDVRWDKIMDCHETARRIGRWQCVGMKEGDGEERKESGLYSLWDNIGAVYTGFQKNINKYMFWKETKCQKWFTNINTLSSNFQLDYNKRGWSSCIFLVFFLQTCFTRHFSSKKYIHTLEIKLQKWKQ